MLVPWCCWNWSAIGGWFSTTGSSAGLIPRWAAEDLRRRRACCTSQQSRSSRSWLSPLRRSVCGSSDRGATSADSARKPVADAGWPQRSLRRCAQRGAVRASRAAAHLGLVRGRGRRNRWHRQQHGVGDWADVVSASSRAERFRPLLCAHHDAALRSSASSSCWAGVSEHDYSRLTILALLPAAGAVLLIFSRQGRQAGGACGAC